MNVKRRYVKPPTRASLAIYRLYYSLINVNYMGSFCPINSYENSVLNKSWFHSIRVRVAKLDFSKVSRVQNPLSFRHTGYWIGCPRKVCIYLYHSISISFYISIYISLWVINQSYNWRAPPWLPWLYHQPTVVFSSHLLSRVVQFLQCGGCPGKITSRCPLDPSSKSPVDGNSWQKTTSNSC